MGEHGMYGKRFMYEESMHIPLIIMNQDLIPYHNLQYDWVVTNLDIAPTILDVAGIEIPSDLHGKSLRSTWIQKAGPIHKEAIYYNYYDD